MSKLRTENDFTDVTLVTDDKVKLPAHKILLSSCSNMFKFILKENTHANTFLYLSGVNSFNLCLILDYIYYGEVNLYQEHLDSFLESAQKLEIEGLTGDNHDNKEMREPQYQQIEEKQIIGSVEAPKIKRRQESNVKVLSRDISRINVEGMTTVEIELKMKELYQKIDGVWSCMECDYTSTTRQHMCYHIEKHMDGLSYTCSLCNKEFRYKNNLDRHQRTSH